MRSRAWGTAAAFALLAAPAFAAAVPAFAAAVPARDAFNGTVSAASGSYGSDVGKVSIAISVPALGPLSRHAIFTLTGSRCRGAARCMRLLGELHGTITVAGPWNPDVGKRFTIAASGRVDPLGHVQVTGSAQSTGFIAHGRESLTLTLHGSSGSVTVSAKSGVVPGFTGP